MRSLVKYVSLFALLGAASALHADTTPPADPSAPAPAPAVAPAPAEPPAKPLTVAEMTDKSAALIAQGNADLSTVMGVREQAKKSQDVIKLNCVNDKLVQLKAQMNIQDTTNHDLQAALSSNSDERFAIYARLTSQHDGILRVREDAKGCIGENDLSKQESGVEVTRPDVPDDPTTQPPLTETVEPPGYASPFN